MCEELLRRYKADPYSLDIVQLRSILDYYIALFNL